LPVFIPDIFGIFGVMRNIILRTLALFLILSLTAAILRDVMSVEFGKTNFWDKHGLVFLFFITFFPRLTLLFSSVATGGVIWWLGFIFTPRILVAALATVSYFYTNPVLVMISWPIALGGEFFEKKKLSTGGIYVRTYRGTPHQAEVLKDDAIEAEFTKK
jgi:hypothetical protein